MWEGVFDWREMCDRADWIFPCSLALPGGTFPLASNVICRRVTVPAAALGFYVLLSVFVT